MKFICVKIFKYWVILLNVMIYFFNNFILYIINICYNRFVWLLYNIIYVYNICFFYSCFLLFKIIVYKLELLILVKYNGM